MAGDGRPLTTLLCRTEESRGWPAFVGHDTIEAARDAVGGFQGRLVSCSEWLISRDCNALDGKRLSCSGGANCFWYICPKVRRDAEMTARPLAATKDVAHSRSSSLCARGVLCLAPPQSCVARQSKQDSTQISTALCSKRHKASSSPRKRGPMRHRSPLSRG